MAMRALRYLGGGLVVAHALLILAYTLPERHVPGLLRTASIRWIRPLFHQQWNLFAPDPSPCHCWVEVGLANGEWRQLVPDDRHYLVRRMERPLAEFIRGDVEQGGTRLRPVLAEALRGLARDASSDAGSLRYRLVQRCVTDPERPLQRAVRITSLELPKP